MAAATLRKWLHMSGEKFEKRNGGVGVGTENSNCGSPSRRQQPHRRRRRLGGVAADAARRLLARARNAVSRVSPAADNNNAQHNVVLPINVTSSHVGRRTNKLASTAAATTTTTTTTAATATTSVEARSVAHGKIVRTRRLMREFQEISTRQTTGSPVFTVELVDDNLYEWYVKLHRIDPDSDLARDMRETNTRFVLLSLSFPENFPFAPPFMRVVSPRIEKGFVMEGGAICMELLTPAGWASAYTVEAIVMQFAASIVKGQGRIVRKVKVKGGGRASTAGGGGGGGGGGAGGASGGSAGKTFNRKSAEASFRSLVKTHDKYGWVTPPLADG